MGIEQHERPDVLDRLAMLRDQVFTLDHIFLSVFGTFGVVLRLLVVMGVLATVRPPMLLLGLIGCRQGSAPLAPVRGQVSYQGNLLPGGVIVFSPDASKGTRGDVAIAEIQPDGTFLLKTGDRAGVAAGWHRVTVAAVRPTALGQVGQAYAMPPSLIPSHLA